MTIDTQEKQVCIAKGTNTGSQNLPRAANMVWGTSFGNCLPPINILSGSDFGVIEQNKLKVIMQSVLCSNLQELILHPRKPSVPPNSIEVGLQKRIKSSYTGSNNLGKERQHKLTTLVVRTDCNHWIILFS